MLIILSLFAGRIKITMKCAFWILYSLSLCFFVTARQKMILLLADGLRWDRYLEDLPSLMRVEQNGVRAEWMDGVFVTLSCPSMYSIATGLYPESHGAIHNLYFDPVTGDRTFNYYSTLNKTEWFDTGAEPVWVTAIMQGLKAGSIMYPGGTVAIKGIKPNKSVAANAENIRNYKMKDRVDDTITWLRDEDFDVVFLYFDNPDTYLHVYGIGSVNGTAKLYEVDAQIGYLFDRLAETGLDQNTNVIIASDHGHINVETDKYIIISDYIDIQEDVEFMIADYGPMFQIVPKNKTDDKVYDALKNAHPALHVYKREEMPERLHYRDNPRILPIVGFVDPGWHMHTRVDLYKLMCEILDIEPAPNNGSRDRYVDMLVKSLPTTDTMTTDSATSKTTLASFMIFIVILHTFVMPFN